MVCSPLPRCFALLLALLLFCTSTSALYESPLRRKKEASSYYDGGQVGYDLNATLENAKRLATHSWEYGSVFQALLEVYDPQHSVYGKHAFPYSQLPNVSSTAAALDYISSRIDLSGKTLADGAGSNGDPASLGVGALLLGVNDDRYQQAADRQFRSLFKAPAFFNGAISQRNAVPELWADAMFMIPPFLAYQAVATNDQSLLREAVRQCGLYRQVLMANTTEDWRGLWVHIVGPESQTLGVWATGNGWATLGMARVLATVKHWDQSANWDQEQGNLVGWMMEIFAGLNGVRADKSTGMLRNYLVGSSDSQDNDSVDWFGDGAGSAALVASALRLAVMEPSVAHPLLEDLEPIRQAIIANVDDQGLITPTVNPLDWYTQQPFYQGSPEGQAFVAMMGAAWLDCLSANVCS